MQTIFEVKDPTVDSRTPDLRVLGADGGQVDIQLSEHWGDSPVTLKRRMSRAGAEALAYLILAYTRGQEW